jgi:OFA family oxalate/formate antiporter-like MFS transporter
MGAEHTSKEMKRTKNRWFIAASAVGIHVSIGSIYAYSAWKMPLENMFGWSPSATTGAFSMAIFFLGLSAAFLGRFIEKKGPSKGGLLSALFFCLGLVGSGLACLVQSLPLFYLCFGVISGIGLGVGYISPVSTLVKWFPDRRGLATGLAIMGFGFGGLICARLIDALVPVQDEVVIPKRVAAGMIPKADNEGFTALTKSAFIEMLREQPEAARAIVALAPSTAALEAMKDRLEVLHRSDLADPAEREALEKRVQGLHRVLIYDRKDIAYAFMILGLLYALVMVPSALYITPPSKEWAAAYMQGKTVKKTSITAQPNELTAKQAMRTFGFYGLWLMLFINVSCGIALIATAKKMGYEMVKLSAEMSTWLVMGISLFNGLGRIFWASLSDYIGRSNTYLVFFGLQILAFPLLANITGLPIAFMLVTFLILSCYGGGFASVPAYISDLFGVKEMPTIHGYILTAWSLAGVVGPMLNAFVYEQTNSYQTSLYIFGSAFLFALLIAIAMKFEGRRIQRRYSEGEIEAERPHLHGL